MMVMVRFIPMVTWLVVGWNVASALGILMNWLLLSDFLWSNSGFST